MRVTTDNAAAAREADLIFIGVKPFTVIDVVRQIKPVLTPEKLIISFAASVKTKAIEDATELLGMPVVRAMPNTPAMLGAGMTALGRRPLCDGAASATGGVTFCERGAHGAGG